MTDFQDEGAFLLAAERSAEALARRIQAAHPSVKAFPLTRDELEALAATLSKSVAIAQGYHLIAALPGERAA